MGNCRHIFVQMNTSGLKSILTDKDPTDAQVREFTIINDQGSMALGNPIDSFSIGVDTDDILYFGIVPSVLYTNDIVYLTDFLPAGDGNHGIVVEPVEIPDYTISFKVKLGDVAEDGIYKFTLKGTLSYYVGSDKVKVPFTIDPVLRANQGHTN
jgi:hypothetical protein